MLTYAINNLFIGFSNIPTLFIDATIKESRPPIPILRKFLRNL